MGLAPIVYECQSLWQVRPDPCQGRGMTTASLRVEITHHQELGFGGAIDMACDARIPDRTELLASKGVAAVLAQAGGGNGVARWAAEVCVLSFLADYYNTPERWDTTLACGRVLAALNSWLRSQSHALYRLYRRPLVSLSALVVKPGEAYVFHVGDTRIYRLRDADLEQVTRDHYLADRQQLSRAMGADDHLQIHARRLLAEIGDVYLLVNRQVHGFVLDSRLRRLLLLHETRLDEAARVMCVEALENGSDGNPTCQIVQVMDVGEVVAGVVRA